MIINSNELKAIAISGKRLYLVFHRGNVRSPYTKDCLININGITLELDGAGGFPLFSIRQEILKKTINKKHKDHFVMQYPRETENVGQLRFAVIKTTLSQLPGVKVVHC